MFYSGVQVSTIVSYVLAVGLVVTYTIIKYAKRGYIFSFQNIYVWMELAILLVITPFLFFPNGVRLIYYWSKSISVSYYYMEKALRLNCIGTILFFLTCIYLEFFRRGCRKDIGNQWVDFSKPLPFISHTLMKMEYVVLIGMYGFICVFVLHGVPIFADTTELLNGFWRVPYMVCISVMPLYTFYFLIYFLNNKKGLGKVMAGIILCFSLGKRSTLLLGTIYPAMIYYFMFLKKKNLSVLRKKTKKIIGGCIVLVIFGLIMMALRSGKEVNIKQLFMEMITGNTFADIRDGGLILFAFENLKKNWLLGKTYLADFFIFIPSSIFTYRRTYGIGAYTAYTLLGMKNHPGLRGGDFMEAYLNFGYIGIVANAILRAIFTARYENNFYENLKMNEFIHPSKIFVIFLWTQVLNLFTSSGGFNNIYCAMAIILINYVLYHLLPKRQ